MRTHYHAETNRWWLYGRNHRHLLNLEWQFFRKATFCCLQLSWEKGFKAPRLHIGIPWVVSLFVHLFDRDNHADYELGLAIHNGSFWLYLFSDPMKFSTGDPWYRRTHSVNFKDFLLGRSKCGSVLLGTEEVFIPMPEGCYPGVAKIERRTWKRPRWPWPLIRESVWINVEGGIPFPGKGENSWDCGMDGICGTGLEGKSVEEAIGHFVGSVLRNRRRYGGRHFALAQLPKNCIARRAA